MTRIGTKIKEIRLSQGLRQVDLAAKSGLTQVHISAIERGTTIDPCISTVKCIASALGYSVDKLTEDVSYE